MMRRPRQDLSIEAADEALWLDVARRSPQATFFHTPQWARIAAAGDPGCDDLTVCAQLADGARAVFPLARRRQRALGRLGEVFSTFAGCYGGPIATRPLEEDEAIDLHRAVARRLGADLHVCLSPFGRWPRAVDGFARGADVTHAVPLDTDFDGVYRRFSRGHQHAYRRARREGLVVRDGSVGDTKAYLGMYESNLARWGDRASSRYAPALFARMSELAATDSSIRLSVACRDGEPMAGVWWFRWNRHIALWHAASHEPPKGVSPLTLLYCEVMREGVERGDAWVDFNPSGGHMGSDDYKRRFGGRELPVVRLVRTRVRNRAVNRALGRARALVGGGR